MALFRERLCFITMCGVFLSYSALISCRMKQRCFVIWLTAFVFTLLLVDLFFGSYVVTSVTALVFNFLPFAFIYTFVGYRYPMAVALAVVSLYFLHVGFRNGSRFCLSLGGIAAGLCLASSIPGKQYVLALVIAAPLYAVFYWRSLKRSVTWSSLALSFIAFWRLPRQFSVTSSSIAKPIPIMKARYVRRFLARGAGIRPSQTDIAILCDRALGLFFRCPVWPRLLFPDVLPIPLPYYWFLVPGVVLALWQKRFEVVLLATLPVVGVFVTGDLPLSSGCCLQSRSGSS